MSITKAELITENAQLRKRVALLERARRRRTAGSAQSQRLRIELAEALEQQTATSEILQVISRSPTEVQPVFETIVRNAVRLCGGVHGGVYRFDGQLVHSVAHDGYTPEELESWRKTWPRPVTAASAACQAIRTKRLVRIADIETAPELSDLSPEARANVRARGSRGLVGVPIRRQDDVIGAIAVTHGQIDGFSDAHLELLKTFADQAVIAIENVRLFTELEEKNRALTTAHAQVTEALDQQTATSEILRVISSSPMDAHPTFQAIAAAATTLCAAENAGVFLFDGRLIHFAAHHRWTAEDLDAIRRVFPRPPGRGSVTARAILTRAVAHVPDITSDPEYVETSIILAGFRAVLSVPMLRDGQAIGAINVTRREPVAFTDTQIALLETFARQAVIAIENVRLFKELEARNADLTEALEQQTATSEILRVISSSPTDLGPVMDAVAENAARLCDASDAQILRADGETITLVASYGSLPTISREPRPISRRLVGGRAIIDRVTLHIPDVTLVQDEFPDSSTVPLGVRTALAIPLLREGTGIGVIMIRRMEVRPFSDKQVALLQTFANQAVIAIENVRLFKELEARTAELTRSVGELTALGEVSQALSSTLDLETVLTTIVSRAVQLSGVDGGVVFEYDSGAEEFVHRAATETGGALAEARRATRVRKGEGVVGRTAITLEPVQVPDITGPGAYVGPNRENLIESGIRAILAVPMVREGQLIGCLVVSRNRAGNFPAETVELLRTFATQSALAIQNAQLFHEIADKSRQLEAASQHKSEFLANMSHELPTPLNAIIGFSEVLAQGMFGDINEKQTEYLHDILESGRHLLSLINDILDLSKIEAGRMDIERADFDLPSAIENALILVRERASRRGIMLGSTIDQRLGMISGDERKVKQVLLNLLSNALKFTPEGGQIDVAARIHDDRAEVSVADTGIGIAPTDQDAVFEEFRQVGTADKKAEGTGLGLALSRKFVELHGGRISVTSHVGAGSTFTFTLPMRCDR
jgi:two-component system, NtrC family, sensor kinase